MSDLFLIKQPWVTEKSTGLTAAHKYTFLVKNSATKNEIKKLVKELYRVDAVKVNMTTKPAKKKGGARFPGTQSAIKKAVVTLKEGQSINIQ